MSVLDSDGHQATRDKILRYLLYYRSNPESDKFCTAKAIAKELNISPNGVRHHLMLLELEQLVLRRERKGKTGRPAAVYSLKDHAMNYFPKSYSEFSMLLLEEIMDQQGEEATRKLLEGVGTRMAEDMRKHIDAGQAKTYASIKDLKQKLDIIKQVFDKFDKFPELVEDEESFLLRNYNCLLFDISKSNPLVCTVHETMIKELIGFQAIKDVCIRDGDGYCQFRINKSENAA
ncbi:MAG: helix-turn-helix transcriptional regulator [Candidatus Hodarchaeales archaeon]|jgi:predicted ArsR family transcriptional regulator